MEKINNKLSSMITKVHRYLQDNIGNLEDKFIQRADHSGTAFIEKETDWGLYLFFRTPDANDAGVAEAGETIGEISLHPNKLYEWLKGVGQPTGVMRFSVFGIEMAFYPKEGGDPGRFVLNIDSEEFDRRDLLFLAKGDTPRKALDNQHKLKNPNEKGNKFKTMVPLTTFVVQKNGIVTILT